MKNITKTALLLLLAAGTMSATAQTSVKAMVCEPLTLTGTEATGSGVLSYQWYTFTNGALIPIPGCATQNCTIAAADAAGGAVEYRRLVTSSDCPSSPSAEATITVHYQGIKVGSVCFAPVNVGTANKWVEKPDDYGGIYQRDRLQFWHPTIPAAGVTIPDWTMNISSASWTVNPCPTGWRLPTYAEFYSIYTNYSWSQAGARGNAVAGMFFSSITRAAANNCTLATDAGMVNCIFLPAVGRRLYSNGQLTQTGAGFYWTNTNIYDTFIYLLYVDSNGTQFLTENYTFGHSIRCVKDV